MMEDGSGLAAQMIQAAVLAGAYTALARTTPEAANALKLMAQKWHDRADTLIELVVAGTVDAAAPRGGM